MGFIIDGKVSVEFKREDKVFFLYGDCIRKGVILNIFAKMDQCCRDGYMSFEYQIKNNTLDVNCLIHDSQIGRTQDELFDKMRIEE